MNIAHFSYTPYSQRGEFCYIIGKSGICYPGVRIENISFPLTIPAVQAAVCSCLANDDEPVAIVETKRANKISEYWSDELNLQRLNIMPENAPIYDPLIKKVDNVNRTLKRLCDYTVSRESNFPVSVLLKTNAGFIPGANVEFSEWNLGLCAERVAISRALASGYADFSGMHVYAPKGKYISPCGTCRQVLFELMPDQMVELHHNDHTLSRHLVSHLLPNAFTSSSI